MNLRRYALLIAAAAALVVVAAGFRFTDDTLMPPQGVVGSSYFHKIDLESGCKGKHVAVISGSLPPGLSLVGNANSEVDTSNWRIQGTPTQAGSFSFWLQATDICPSFPAERALTITILPKVTVTTESLSPILLNQPYSFQLTATGAGSYTWSVASGTLPPGLALSTGGLLSGTPTQVGASTFTVLAREGNRSDTKTLTLTVVEQLVASAGELRRAEVSRPFVYTPTVRGGLTPYTWSIASGTLPSGLALDPATGAVRGTPLAAGAFPVQLQVKDSAGLSATVPLGLAVARKLALTTTRLRPANEARRYSAPLVKAGGVGPFVYRIVGGRLPAGLRLNTATGRISGVPLRDGRFEIRVRVRDSLGAISTPSRSASTVLPA